MNKLGQGLAVGLSALASCIVACVGICCSEVPQDPNITIVMIVPVIVAVAIGITGGWE